MTQGIERTSVDFGGMSGSKVRAFPFRNQAAFLSPNLIPATAKYVIWEQNAISNSSGAWKTLYKETKHVLIAQLVAIL